MSYTFFCHNIDVLPIGGCTSWTVSTSSVTATDFWVSPTSETLATFNGRIDLDVLMNVSGDSVYIQHGSNVVYTTDFGANWTTVALVDFIPIDTVWDDREKTSASFSLCAFPNGAASSAFYITSWRYVDGDFVVCFYNPDSDAGFIANMTDNTILKTGFSTNVRVETSALAEHYVGVPYMPEETQTFCYWDDQLTTLGMVFETTPGDPYTSRPALLKGNPENANAVTLEEGTTIAYRMEVVNGNVLWYGLWGGPDGGSTGNRYGLIDGDIAFGGSYTFTASWRQPVSYALSWWADSAPTYQPSMVSSVGTSANYPATTKQRAAKWLNSEVMFAGVQSKRYGYVYTNLTDSSQIDYTSIWNYGARDAFEVMPVPEKGAFISMEIINTNLINTTIKISPTANPADFSTAVTLNLPVAKSVNFDNVAMFYSTTQAKFLMVYGDSASKIHVIQFDDPFVCAVYE